MEHVAATKLLPFQDVTEADAALKLLRLRGLNVLECPELVNELAPFVKLHDAFAQTCQIVDHLAQDVNRERTPSDNNVEKLHVDQKVKRIEDQ